MLNTLRILLTGAGAPGVRGTLYALRSNPDRTPVYTVGVDAKAEVVGKHFVDSFYQVPAPEHPSYVDTLLTICRTELVQVLIPQTTRENVVLARYKERFASAGVRVMVSEDATTEVANDKGKLLGVFERLGLPVPEYFTTNSEEALVQAAYSLGYPERPVVVKMPVSNGMRGLRILKEAAWDLNRFINEKPSGVEVNLSELLVMLRRGDFWPELLVTEYLPGAEYSVDAFIGQHVQIAIPRIRQSIRSGISFDNVMEFRPDLIDYTLQVGAHLGMRYAFGFQYKLDHNGVPKVLECNPRVQGTMVASLFSGVNIIWMAVQEVLGTSCVELPPLRPASFHRYWGGIGVWEDGIDEI